MRLNGASLNGSSARRLPVALDGAAVLAVASELAPIRRVRMSGAAPIALAGEFQATARRYLVGEAPVTFDTALAQTVSRGASGTAVICLAASLYYVKQIHGYGTAVLSIDARGDVGVVFIDGQAVLTPLQVEMDGRRAHHGTGTAVVAVVGDFTASAIRRPQPAGATLLASMTAVLEPSHIDGGGVRHIGMFGDAPVSLQVEDAGMLRQALIGSLDMRMLAATGTLTVRRPTLASAAVKSITATGAFRADRRGDGAAVKTVVAQCDGEILVRGEGAATLRIVATGTGYAYRKSLAGAAEMAVRLEGDWAWSKVGGGTAVIEIGAALDGARRQFFSGPMVIQALDFGSGVINPYREDNDRQKYTRPGLPRELRRSAYQREYRR